MYHLNHMKSFHEELHICETCYNHLYENEIRCQAVCNKMALNSTADELRHFNKLEKVIIFKIILLKIIATMHGKGEFSKIKGSTCSSPIESASICYIYQGLQFPKD